VIKKGAHLLVSAWKVRSTGEVEGSLLESSWACTYPLLSPGRRGCRGENRANHSSADDFREGSFNRGGLKEVSWKVLVHSLTGCLVQVGEDAEVRTEPAIHELMTSAKVHSTGEG